MVARSDWLIGAQIGVESTYGTGVTAGKKLPLMDIDLSPDMQQRQYRGAGFKYPNGRVKHREWAIGNWRMPLTFTEPLYPLGSYLGGVTPAQIGATAGYTWAHVTSKTASDTPKSYTVQIGDATAAQEVNGWLFNSIDLSITQEDAEMSGEGFGQVWDDTATLDSVGSTIEQTPISINQVDLYFDTTYAGLGTTKWTKPYEVQLRFPRKWEPLTVLNTTYQSFVEPVEVPVEDITGTIVVMDDSQARSFSAALRAATLPPYFLQVKIIGANIGASADYTHKINMCVKLTNTRARRGIQNTYAREFDFALFADTSMTSPIEWTLVNKATAY